MLMTTKRCRHRSKDGRRQSRGGKRRVRQSKSEKLNTQRSSEAISVLHCLALSCAVLLSLFSSAHYLFLLPCHLSSNRIRCSAQQSYSNV